MTQNQEITPEVVKEHGLSSEEYEKILEILGREPNIVELGIFSVMWSEHCSYKSSRKFLKRFPTDGECVIEGPGENAGVIDIGDGDALVFKMESHNHPSFIEPYQGAATGVGGILRDVFTMGARPIANLNSLRFGQVDHEKTPFLVEGVVAGIAGYGNCMGIPTVGGEVYFDPCYNGNILVNAMTVGLAKTDNIFKGVASGVGNPVMYVGSKTGRDGIHGATMASDSFDEESEQKRPTVQVGDPFTEKRLLEACLELMAEDAIIGIQDMGAAGLTSSSFEMASRAETGLLLNLDQVPLREEGMTPYEMMLSESQERMLLVCKPGKEELVEQIFTKWDLDATVIGEVTNTGMYQAKFQGEMVIDVPVAPLVDAAPVYDRPRKEPSNLKERQSLDLSEIPVPENLQDVFIKLLSHPQNASKAWIYEQYDHQVMTNTVILPGSDAAVVRIKGTKKGVAMTTNVNSRYCFQDPKLGGLIAVAESGRNLVCSGAKPMAITDCLNFGNPEKPEIMWEFEQCIEGISQGCEVFDTPVVSGNVSFYNETNDVSIYPTPTLGMVGLLSDINSRLDIFFKNEGDHILLLGETLDELGSSEYLDKIHGMVKGLPPQMDIQKEKNLWKLISSCYNSEEKTHLLNSAHDLSEGGLAISLAESCFSQNPLGVEINLNSNLRMDSILFGETQSRVMISVSPDKIDQVVELAGKHDVPIENIGVIKGSTFKISINDQEFVNVDINELKKKWQQGFSSLFKTKE